jgi:hypothetical protein
MLHMEDSSSVLITVDKDCARFYNDGIHGALITECKVPTSLTLLAPQIGMDPLNICHCNMKCISVMCDQFLMP